MNTKSRSVLINLFVVMILDLLAFTCILPLFPSLMDFYASRSETGDIYDVVTQKMSAFQQFIGVPDGYRYNSVLFGGFLGSMFSFLQFLSSPIFGALSDVFGRKPLLLISAAGSMLSYIIWSQSNTFGLFMLSRFIGGLSKASVSVATAVVADVMPTKSRGKGMVMIGAAFSVGFIIGPLIGAYFAHGNRADIIARNSFSALPPYFAISLSFIEICWILLFIPETVQKTSDTTQTNLVIPKIIDYISPRSLTKLKSPTRQTINKELEKVQRFNVINFAFLLIYSGLEFTLTFFTHLFFDYSSIQQGQLYFMIGLLMVFIQGCFVRRVAAEKQEFVAKMGIISIGCSFTLISITALLRNRLLFYVSLVCFSFGSATVVTSLTTIVSANVSEFEQGTVLGIFRSSGALARALGPCLASAVFWMFGPSICYLLGGAAMTIPLYLLWTIRQRIDRTNYNKE